MQQIDGTSLLVTIGEDLSSEAVLKVWALDQTEKKTGAPKCLSTVNIFNGRKKFPVSLNQGPYIINNYLMIDARSHLWQFQMQRLIKWPWHSQMEV